MGNAGLSWAPFEKRGSQHEAQIHRAMHAVVPGDAPLLLADRQKHIPGSHADQQFVLRSKGPPRGNDLMDLFSARVDAAHRAPEARWKLVQDALAGLRGVQEGLDCMHGMGFAHGDVKPENAVSVNGRVYLVDFGESARLTPAGTAAWTAVNQGALRTATWAHPGRKLTDEVLVHDQISQRGRPECSMGPPTVADDHYRALAGFYRLLSALDRPPPVATNPNAPPQLQPQLQLDHMMRHCADIAARCAPTPADADAARATIVALSAP